MGIYINIIKSCQIFYLFIFSLLGWARPRTGIW